MIKKYAGFVGNLHMGRAAGSKQRPKPRSLLQTGLQLRGFPSHSSKSKVGRTGEVSGADRLQADGHHVMVSLLLDTPVRAPCTRPAAQGAQLTAGMGALFFPPRGVETVFLVQTTLFDAGPSS